jgi:hypothetical protein
MGMSRVDPRTQAAFTAVLHGMDPLSVEDLCRAAQREVALHRDAGQPRLQEDLFAMVSAALDVHEFQAIPCVSAD